MGTPVRVCFVCLGNICRSPTAEGVFRHLVANAGLEADYVIDSAGTAAHHVGEPPDVRASATARAHGVTLTGAARRFEAQDFERFDHVIAMDRANHADLVARAEDAHSRSKVSLLREWEPDGPSEIAGAEVPDPYYGGDAGFERVFEMCMRSGLGLLAATQPAGQ